MAPKKKPNEPNKKTQDKQKTKVIEDKTFGLKNKKGAKQQKFITHVSKTVLLGSKTAKQLAKEQDDKFARKELKKKEQDELNSLFKPVEQKIGKGADPKSVLCAFFKAGSCQKGDKCKFSHDLNIQRKGEKKNIYESEETEDTMADWDEEKLEEVVNKKHGESNKTQTQTNIICKFFVEAVENSKYGWFWECPNGTGCRYKHCLPPGFVLKKDKKKAEDQQQKDEISLEELIEKERAALSCNNLTQVTLESFMKWKAKKKKEKIVQANKAKDGRKNEFKQGKVLGISGREIFEFNPDLVADELEDGDEGSNVDLSTFKRESDDEGDDTEVREIDLDELAAAASEVDGTGSKAKEQPIQLNGQVTEKPPQQHDDEAGKLDMAAGGAAALDPGLETEAAIDMPIDENLFDGDDLLEVEEELETLEL